MVFSIINPILQTGDGSTDKAICLRSLSLWTSSRDHTIYICRRDLVAIHPSSCPTHLERLNLNSFVKQSQFSPHSGLSWKSHLPKPLSPHSISPYNWWLICLSPLDCKHPEGSDCVLLFVIFTGFDIIPNSDHQINICWMDGHLINLLAFNFSLFLLSCILRWVGVTSKTFNV